MLSLYGVVPLVLFVICNNYQKERTILAKYDSSIKKNEVIDIILQRHIILVPVIDDKHKLIGLVDRPDILKQNLNQKFVTITDKRK